MYDDNNATIKTMQTKQIKLETFENVIVLIFSISFIEHKSH